MRIAVGPQSVASIDADLEEPIDPDWGLGRFRLWVRGQPIGDWSDSVTLKGVGAWWRDFVEREVARWDPTLWKLDKTAMFKALAESLSADEPGQPRIPDRQRFSINQLGMSAFDPYVVLLIEPPTGGQRVVWSRVDSASGRAGVVKEAILPEGELQRLGAEFVTQLYARAPALANPRPRVQPTPPVNPT